MIYLPCKSVTKRLVVDSHVHSEFSIGIQKKKKNDKIQFAELCFRGSTTLMGET